MPHFSNVTVISLHFYERPILVLIFTNQKISEENFYFYEKRQKVKIEFSMCCSNGDSHASALGKTLSVKPP